MYYIWLFVNLFHRLSYLLIPLVLLGVHYDSYLFLFVLKFVQHSTQLCFIEYCFVHILSHTLLCFLLIMVNVCFDCHLLMLSTNYQHIYVVIVPILVCWWCGLMYILSYHLLILTAYCQQLSILIISGRFLSILLVVLTLFLVTGSEYRYWRCFLFNNSFSVFKSTQFFFMVVIRSWWQQRTSFSLLSLFRLFVFFTFR